MPRIRFVRGVIWNKEPRGVGEEHDVTEREAFMLCEGYKDAVRITGEAPQSSGMTVREQIVTRDPVAEHRDPASEPAKRRK